MIEQARHIYRLRNRSALTDRSRSNHAFNDHLRNNPPDVVYSAFAQAFFQGVIRMFQRDSDMKSIVLSDAEAREQAVRHFFNQALREVQEAPAHAD